MTKEDLLARQSKLQTMINDASELLRYLKATCELQTMVVNRLEADLAEVTNLLTPLLEEPNP